MRALFSIYNPRKLQSEGSGNTDADTEAKECVRGGIDALVTPYGFSANDNVSLLMRANAGEEQDMIHNLKTKYGVPKYMVALLPKGDPRGDISSNHQTQQTYAKQVKTATSSISAAASFHAYKTRVGHLLWTAILQATIWSLLLVVGYLALENGSRGPIMPSVRLAT